MRYGSVCSGIEAATAAWHGFGWHPQWFSEIDAFPCAVLAHHYPSVPNLGDMTKYKEWPDATIDVLVGGTPCQSFSIAGLRKGLSDPRGNLMLTFGAVAAKYRPRWLVWENVPGVLSSNGGRDFGALLGMLGKLGYGFAYRVLDAQYFGVAQRRRRVFVVGYIGDWRPAAAVLFERHSLSGNSAPSREARQTAPTIPARRTGGGGLGTDFDCDGGLITGTLQSSRKAAGSATQQDAESGLLSAHTLRGEGFDASEDGAGLSTPIVPVEIAGTMKSCKDSGGWSNSADHAAAGYMIPVAFPERLSATQCVRTENLSPALGSLNPTAVAVSLRGRDGGATAEIGDEIQSCLRASKGGGDKPHVLHRMMVRRLTPRECERLQGFPDDYTLIPTALARRVEADYYDYLKTAYPTLSEADAQRLAKDGPRYKAIGNSMAVPVMKWIGQRMRAVDAIVSEEA